MRPEHWLYTIPLRLRSLFHRAEADRELDEELCGHVEEKTEEYVAGGLSPSDARRQALLEIDGIEKTKEECRDTRRVSWLQDFAQDLRFGIRILRKSPGFATVAILTLALGIGANTAIFSVVEAVVLKPLSFRDPERLFVAWTTAKGIGDDRTGVSMPEFEDFQSQSHSFEYLANLLPLFHYTWIGDGEPKVVRCTGISHDFFPMLGIQPLLGRLYEPQEYHVDGVQVVVSYSFWQNDLGGDPHVIGRFLNVDNTGGMTIIGVMPPMPDWFPDTDIWAKDVPDFDWVRLRGNRIFWVAGRLKHGVTRQQAERELTTIVHRGAGEPHDLQVVLVPLKDQIVGDTRIAIEIVMGAASLVFLIALVNVAYLLLARSSRRQTEIALRVGLGAPLSRILRQFVTENLVLALLGGALGVPLAINLLKLISRLNLAQLPRSNMIQVDWHVLAFALTVTLILGVLLALAPAAGLGKLDLNSILKTGRSGMDITAKSRFRLLLISEVSLAVVLVVGAGLLVRSFWAVEHVNLGFQPDRLITAFLRTNYFGRDGAEFYNRTLQRVSELPGVQSVAVSNCLPTSDSDQAALAFFDRPNDPNNAPVVGECWISSDYFQTVGTPLLHGRTFTPRDDLGALPVAIINQELAQRYWPGQNPIGKHFALRPVAQARAPLAPRLLEVVGVVANVKYGGLELPTEPFLYTPFLQDEENRVFVAMNLFIRSAADSRSLIQSVPAAVHAVEPNQPVEYIRTMDSVISTGLASRRLTLLLVGSFAGLALLLAAVGIYGMIAYFVSQRTREMALRIALGAHPSDVLRMVMRQGFTFVSAGLFLGLLFAVVLTRLMSSLLFGVTSSDPMTFLAVIVLLAAVALLACYIPARRAMRVDPIVALRYE
jgi:putative ABC transport system permease protein